jgi:hypothetical protein
MKLDPLQREILAEMGYTVYGAKDADVAAADSASAPPVPRTGADPAKPPGTDPDFLLRALLRAAGRDPDDAQALALCRGLLPPEGLRDARSRRALWPRLRRLRARTAR